MPKLQEPQHYPTYGKHAYLRVLKAIEWLSAWSDSPGVEVQKFDETLFEMQMGVAYGYKDMVLKAAEAVGHIAIREVPGINGRLITLTPDGHDYLFRFTRSAATGTVWDKGFMGCDAPFGGESLFKRKVY